MQDREASILARLKNKAKNTKISYQQCLLLFFQEEFLRRLSKSKYSNNFILKGGLFIYTLTNFQSRPTVDIDFLLQHLTNEPKQIDKVISEILSTPTGFNDIIIMEAGETKPIAIQMKYHGVSIQVSARIKKVRVVFSIDIGIGDIIVPKPEKRSIQTQLDNYEKPEIYTYSLESVIAEKFDAILQRFELTSRMKDFYDIFYLSHKFDFEGEKLQEAILQTLNNRGTSYDIDSFDRILQLSDNNDIQLYWRNFQKAISDNTLSFSDVIKSISIFLQPVYKAIISEHKFIKKWKAKQQIWE